MGGMGMGGGLGGWGGGWGGGGAFGGMGGFGAMGGMMGGGWGNSKSRTRSFTPSECPDIHSFISENGLDDRCGETLLRCSMEVQAAVMARGNCKDCRNPSSAILGRIKEIHSEGVGHGEATEEEVEGFIMEAMLDDRASASLRNSTPEVQRIVIDRVTLAAIKNPNSAVLGRIKDAQRGVAAGGGGGMIAVQKFLMENPVDERAAQALQELPPNQQAHVLARGSLRDAQNPSSALLGRVRDAKKNDNGGGKGGMGGMGGMNPMVMMMKGGMNPMMGGMGGMGGFGGCGMGGMGGMGGMAKSKGAGGVMAFVAQNGLDERAAESLMSAEPSVQQAVLARGSLADARNPSSALLGRIRDAKQALSGGGGGIRSSPY